MIIGYGIIAVPTGIVSAEYAKSSLGTSTKSCTNCSKEGHDPKAKFCSECGEAL